MPMLGRVAVAAARAYGLFSQALRAVDQYFNYVTLLLPGNGTNGAQNNTFLDSSTNAFSITRNGNTTQGTFSPFSQTGWSNYFDGSGDYLNGPNNAAFAFGTGNFTIEAIIYPTATKSIANAIFDTCAILGNGARPNAILFFVSPTNTLAAFNNGTRFIDSTTTIPLNSWTHVAITRSGTSVKLWINGVDSATATNSANLSEQNCNIGVTADTNSGNGFFDGYVSNLRIVKGTAVYTSNFTPPTAPLTDITNTSLLTCQSNRFIDNSTNAFAITRNGDASVQAFSPFNPTSAYSAATNGGSGYFDGSGDWLGVADSTALDLNTTFTVEGWFYQPTAGNGTIFARGGGAGSWSLTDGHEYIAFVSSGQFYWQFNSGGGAVSITASAPAAGAWHHFAVGYNGTTTRVWLDGASIGTSTSVYSLPATRNLTRVGLQASNTGIFTGYISGLRVVKGTDVYGVGNTSITVPTAPLTAITNTSLLLNFTNGGITDAAAKNDLETVGNAQISTTQSKWGGSSMYFDGTGDYLLMPSNTLLAFGTGDYTIEFWARHASVSGQQTYVGDTPGNTNGAYVYKDTSNKVGLYYTAQILTGTTTIAVDTWYFIAVSRASGTVRLFVNGTQEASASDSTNLSVPVRYVGGDTLSGDLNGYIQDLRITKGVARYTSNFTPPTAAFPVQ